MFYKVGFFRIIYIINQSSKVCRTFMLTQRKYTISIYTPPPPIGRDMQHYTLMFEDAVDTVMKFIIIDTYLDLIYDMICNT